MDLTLRLWYLLRQAAPCGWLATKDVYRLSCGNKRQTGRWLARGENKFWHVVGGRLYLHGLGKVCAALGVKPVRPPVATPLSEIEDLQRFRAALFASWFADASEQGRVISQAALSEIFGRTDRTLRTWAKLARMTVVPNLATVPAPRKPEVTISHWKDVPGDKPNQKPNLVWFERHAGDLWLVWKMPNTYVCSLQCGPKTTLQKEAARHVPDNAAGTPDKLYWRRGSKAGSMARALQAGRTVYEETDRKHSKTGEVLWRYHTA